MRWFPPTIPSLPSCPLPALVLAALASGLLGTPAAHAQNDASRREYFTPGLVVETGFRRGACDALIFTSDGKHLLAVGDDKVVRVWKYTAGQGLGTAEVPLLRWRTWHESRGNIYALALSPDKENRLVAIGGQGMSSAGASLAVFDRMRGTIRHAFGGSKKAAHRSVWSMTFDATGSQLAYGDQDGGVWVWDLEEGKATEPRSLGKHDPRPDHKPNYVRLVMYWGKGQVISVDATGEVRLWKVPPPGQAAAGRQLFRFETRAVFRAAVSPDGMWLAVASEANKAVYVELCSFVDGLPRRKIYSRQAGHVPHSLAFDHQSRRLAVGVRVIGQPETNGANFYQEIDGHVLVYDLADLPLPESKVTAIPKGKAIPVTYNPEAVAFHPDGRHLAVAGGDDHEVVLWDLKGPTKVSELVGPGNGLWAVALSPDARHLAYKDRRNRDAKTPNDRGAGDWKVFDLQQRRWAAPGTFTPASPSDSAGGWKVRTSLPGKYDSYIWYVEGPEGQIKKLPLDQGRDFLPRCYAFLPAVAAKDDAPARPVRLAVGHLWGISIFELRPEGPRLVRLLTGHEGEVMALAVSADQKRLVSVSRDETVAGWALEDWPSHPELGARFFVRQGRLFVDAVDAGGPAWEAGLSKGDELILLAADRNLVFNRFRKYGKDVGDAAAALAALERPEPGKELYFAWKRPGEDKAVEQLTSLRQRPLWRFFPTRQGEWVLWRWRDYYYDTSTNGDFLIGWQRNYDDPLRTPEYFKAEQFRKEYHKPERVAATLKDWKSDPGKVAFLDLEPPAVQFSVAEATVKDRDLVVTLTATPRGRGQNHQITRVLLWVNDYQFERWATPQQLKLDRGGVFRRKVVVPRARLRRGANLLTLQAYNQGDVRGETKPVKVVLARAAQAPDLYGVFVGVSDYSKTRLGEGPNNRPRRLPSLLAGKDAQAMFRLWQRRAGPLYEKVHLAAPLLDAAATRANILKQLKDLEGKVRPDDRLVFHLGGHGTRPDELEKAVKEDLERRLQGAEREKALQAVRQRLKGLGRFLYCCADFDIDRLRETTVSFEELYEALVRLPCHKVIMLDACHAGDTRTGLESVSSNPIRVLTQDGVGPIILAACQPTESAYEQNAIDLGRAFGLFTIAVRRTLEEKFAQADTNRDGALEPGELFASVSAQVQVLLTQLRRARVLTDRDQQTPVAFLPSLGGDLQIVRRPDKK
jgi:WD40 repeat protein